VQLVAYRASGLIGDLTFIVRGGRAGKKVTVSFTWLEVLQLHLGRTSRLLLSCSSFGHVH
jgi:hypothetical protein